MMKMKMTIYTVILVLGLVLVNCEAKVVLREESLTDPAINIISKNDIETDSEIHMTLTTTTRKPTEVVGESVNIKPTAKFEIDNKIDEININETSKNFKNGSSNNQTHNEPSQPLKLTLLLQKGLAEEAREASRVDPSLFLGFESYSGFFTVNETYNSNVFFWYFPVDKKPVNKTPWIIWLQGGPGASSLHGLFDEIGPIMVDSSGTLIKNPFTWQKNHSLLFIDNPVGAGFSFTEHHDGYVKDMATYANHLFSTVQQFLQVFPELRDAPLFIAGESYAGKYVPALAMELHKHKDEPGKNMNLQGLLIGNGYVDPSMIVNITQTFYYFGLLEKEEIETLKPLAQAFQRDIANNDSLAAKNRWTNLIVILLFLTSQNHAYNFLKDDVHFGRCTSFVNRSDIRKAIHVGEMNFSFINFTTNVQLAPDFLSTSQPLLEELLEHYRVLAYCGQLDQMLPCVATSENYRTWKWSGAGDFLNATRHPYIFNRKLAGYSKTGGRLTEVVVRGAGHMVPVDAPAPAQALVSLWTHNKPLNANNALREGPFVRDFVASNSADVYLYL